MRDYWARWWNCTLKSCWSPQERTFLFILSVSRLSNEVFTPLSERRGRFVRGVCTVCKLRVNWRAISTMNCIWTAALDPGITKNSCQTQRLIRCQSDWMPWKHVAIVTWTLYTDIRINIGEAISLPLRDQWDSSLLITWPCQCNWNIDSVMIYVSYFLGDHCCSTGPLGQDVVI